MLGSRTRVMVGECGSVFSGMQQARHIASTTQLNMSQKGPVILPLNRHLQGKGRET